VEFRSNAVYVKKNGNKINIAAIIMEYAHNGDLFEFLVKGAFPEAVARTYFHQLIEGLSYMHKMGYSHRDLKPENLLFDHNMNLKIADFGFAKALEGKNKSGVLRTNLGSRGYKAPEIEMKYPYNGATTDIFACGVILFIMKAGF